MHVILELVLKYLGLPSFQFGYWMGNWSKKDKGGIGYFIHKIFSSLRLFPRLKDTPNEKWVSLNCCSCSMLLEPAKLVKFNIKGLKGITNN